MEFAVGFELQLFLYSILFGIACSMIYDFFRALRIFFKTNSWVVFVEDVIFWVLITGLSFLFILLANNGQVRLYIFLAAGIGSIAYFSTVSKILIRIFHKTAQLISEILQWVVKQFFVPIGKYVKKMTKWVKYLKQKRNKSDKI